MSTTTAFTHTGARARPRDPQGHLARGGELRERTSLVRPALNDGRSSHFEAIEAAPRAEIEALQERRLLAALPYVYERSALIRSVWQKAGLHPSQVRSMAEFQARAPFIDKDMLRDFRDAHNDAFGGVLCHAANELSVICSSTGTTGDPTLFADRWGSPSIQYHLIRDYWEAGVRPGDYAAVVTVTMRPPGHTVFHDMGVTPLMFNHDPRELQRLADWSRAFRPTALILLSSILIHGLEQLEQRGVDIREAFSSYKICLYGGEALGPRAQRLIERWGLPLRSMTALGDVGTAIECSARDGHHAWEDLALIEVLDPQTLAPVADGGRGELIVSSLHDRVVPFLRFRSGDMVRYTRAACACGRTHLRFWALGRLSDETRVGSKSVMPADLWPAIESVPETASALFQIVRAQPDVDVLRVRVGYDGEPDLQAVRDRVRDAVHNAVDLLAEIELVPNAELIKLGPPQKIPRVAKK
jgi:phenylacetate-CoA ligase